MVTIIIPGWRHLTDNRRRFGLKRAVAGLCYRGAQRLLGLRVNELMVRPLTELDSLAEPPGIEGLEYRPLTAAEVRDFAADPHHELTMAMADRLEAGHDWCFAALADGRLVNYSWYALGSIESLHCHVALSFPADIVYMYKAFTHPDFRGVGVHRATFVRAARWLVQLAFQRVVLIIEYANWHSLRSHQRLGFRRLGFIVTAGRGALRFERHPCVAQNLDLRFGAQADLAPRQIARQENFASRSNAEPIATPCFIPELDRCSHGLQKTTG